MFNARPSAGEVPSTGQLLRSTAIAAAVALVLLVTVVLPAEYGIDPTRVGRVLGLTQMGEIKVRLAQEAAKEDVTPVAPSSVTPAPQASTTAAPAPATAAPAAAPAVKSDEFSVTLGPGQAAEVKVEMRKSAQITYRWTASGGQLNFDTHGDPYDAPRNAYHGYGKGRAEADQGVLEAAFDGFHGWFWRNRTKQSVTVRLRVEGDYIAMKRIL